MSRPAVGYRQDWQELPVEVVYVMFKCHLDVGFTDTEENVLRQYFEQHLPAAIDTAERLRLRGGEERLVWTVPAWLLYTYLQQATGAALQRAEAAIAAGDLVWHALPFTWYTELLDRSSVEASMQFAKVLDGRFGKRTTAARLTDVPGHTRGLVSVLADAGVTFLDIGCNPGCKAPGVPFFGPDGLLPESGVDVPDPDTFRTYADEPVFADRQVSDEELRRLSTEAANEPRTHLFNWRAPDGKQVAVLYHPTAYGGTARLPGTTAAVSMRVHGDNHGPQTVTSIEAAYASLRSKFPGARIVACDLSTIAEVIAPLQPYLPVVTQEIGDTWIYGTGSDPAKTSALREVLRMRRGWIESAQLQSGGADDLRLLAELIAAPEHNWGLNTSVYLREWDSYPPDALAAARSNDEQFAAVDREWAVKRERPRRAVQSLPQPLRTAGLAGLQRLAPVLPSCAGMTPATDPVRLVNENFEVTLSDQHGGITGLIDRATGREWATAAGLGTFSYQTFSADDYVRYNAAYNSAAFADNDFAKPGLRKFDARSRTVAPDGADFWLADGSAPQRAVGRLRMPEPSPEESPLLAWPAQLWVEYRLAAEGPHVEIRLVAAGKRASRLPEAMWFSFCPAADDPDGWLLDKLGQQVAPQDVIADGGRHLHGVGRGAEYRDADGGLGIDTVDAPLVAPGRPALLEFDNDPLDLRGGMHVNLYNNLWGTAFPQWYDEDMQFRFGLRVLGPRSEEPSR